MVNNQSKLTGASDDKPKKRVVEPVIPLVRSETKDLKKGEYVVIKCRIRPNDNDSPTYDLPIPYFGTGSAEEFLSWKDNLKKAIKGQDVNDGPGKFAMARRLLRGDALTAFNNAALKHASETGASYNATIKSLTAHVFPLKALQQQKRYMRRFMRKPRELKVQEFVCRVGELNEFLLEFPTATPGAIPTKLPEDEIMDILEFSVPASWQRQMEIMDFNPINETPQAFINFCQRLELHESASNGNGEKKKSSKQGKKGSGSNKRKQSTSFEEGLDCILHGKNCGHVTDDCWTLKRQAERLKKEGKKPSKADKDMNVLMKKAVVEAINVASGAKKARKTPTKKDKTEELQAFAQLTVLSDGEIAEAVEDSDHSDSEQE